MNLGCGFYVGLFVLGLAFIFLFQNPILLLFVLSIILIVAGLMLGRNKKVIDARVREGMAMAGRIEALANRLTPVECLALSLRPGETAFYELGGVELREYRSKGSTYKGGYLGGNLSLTQGFSVSAGGNSGKLVRDEEEATTLDVGTAIFTTQRVIFSGPKQTREWDLAKLLNIDVGENGYVVSISSGSSQRTAALAGPMELGITPGILFTIALETFKEGDEAGRAYAQRTARDIRAAAEAHFQKRGKPLIG